MTIGGSFVPYSSAHWAVLALIAAFTAVLALVMRRAAGQPREAAIRRTVCWSLAILLVAGWAGKQVHEVVRGSWSLQESLPLHLCDLGLLVTAVALVGAGLHGRTGAHRVGHNPPDVLATPAFLPLRPVWQQLYELAYFWGLGGTVQAVLTPDLDSAFPSFDFFRYFLAHGGIVVSVLAMTIGLRLRPQPGAPRRAWLWTLALAVVVILVDWACGANYMYLCGRPKHPSLIDYLGRWPWSLLPLLLLGTTLIGLCYAPFWLTDRCKRRGTVRSP